VRPRAAAAFVFLLPQRKAGENPRKQQQSGESGLRDGFGVQPSSS